MGFWNAVEISGGMGRQYHWFLLGTVFVALLLATVVPYERKRVRTAVLMIGAAFAGNVVCGLMLHRGSLPTYAAYRYVHFITQLLLAASVINLAGVLVFRVVLTAVGLEPAPILRDTLLGVAYVVVGITLLSRHGVDLSGIVATSAVVTAVIGFSLQDTLGNIMGGVALQMERSIEVGDWVKLGEVEGVVREIRWRQTSIETRDWDTVVIPNSVLMKSQVTVLGRRSGQPKLHRMWVEFNVDFRHGPAEVVDAVTRALRGGEPIPNVATEPAPECVFTDFKDSFGRYAVRYWLTDFLRNTSTSSEVRTRVFVALQRAGVTACIPAQSVFLTMESRSRAERKGREEKDRRAAALKGVALLEPLTDAERGDLAGRLTVAPFRRGEVITRQGNEAHYLYVLTQGEAEVRVATGGETRVVAKLAAHDVFGEMGMLTGEPRTATIVALSDVVCYRLDKDAFHQTLQNRPEIAEAMSHLLAQRKVRLEALTAGDASPHKVDHTQRDLLQRIRKFFTLG